METIDKKIGLPDPLAPFNSNEGGKLSKEYGLQIAKIISSDWFGGANGLISSGCEYLTRREYVRQKRLFVRGENSVEYFKKQLFDSGQLEYVNMDFSINNVVEKFARIVSNGLDDKNTKLDVRATDKLTAIKKGEKRDFYLKYMKSKPMLERAVQLGMPDLRPKTFIPEDEEEMQLFMEIKDRPKIEIAEEILIDYVLNTNKWQFLSGQYRKDIVDVGIVIARVYTDKNDGVKLAYVDPENYGHSKVTRNDFDDKYYEYVVDTITIADLKRESGFDDMAIRKIAQKYGSQNSGKSVQNYSHCAIDELLGFKIDVCRFAYKTQKTITYKKKIRNGETVKLSRKDDNYQAPKREDVGVTSGTFDTWLEGSYVIGSEYIYDYKECENNYDDIMNKAMSPFITVAYDIYENRLRSFTDNIEKPAREIQKISLKIQHLISELTPDLKEIDLDQLAELDDGKGGVKNEVWKTALELMGAKGVIFKKRINMGEDGIKDSHAAKPLPSQQGSALTILLNVWAHYYNLIRENTGVNPARDGSMPADSLVGVNELAKLASNTATLGFVKSYDLFKKEICEVISTRIHTIFSYPEAKKVREVYENVVGKQMLDFMDVLKDRNLHEFGFTFEMVPTSDELNAFAKRLDIAQGEQSIDVEVAYQAEQLAKVNIKKATEYLMYQRRRRMKEAIEKEKSLATHKSQGDAMAAQAKVQAELQSYQAKAQIDLMKKSKEIQMEVEKEAYLDEIKLPKEQREFEKEVYLTKLESMASFAKEEFKEDRKDDRTKLQASQQSEILDQRNKDKDPIDFETKDDWFAKFK